VIGDRPADALVFGKRTRYAFHELEEMTFTTWKS